MILMTEIEEVLTHLINNEDLLPSFDGVFGYELYIDLDRKTLTLNNNSDRFIFLGYYIAYQKEELINDLLREIEREKLQRKMIEKGLI